MCAIAGIYHPFSREKVDTARLSRMLDLMHHRGPDDSGTYVDGGLGLGHRRLSIVDLSRAGHQPMSNEDDSIWITYNGEIYNAKSLTDELKKKGHQFKGRSDTESIVHLYEQMGEECLSRLNGIFAFAIWDKKKQTLFLARDRFGVKPLYYVYKNGVFLFASEIKALLIWPFVSKALNYQALDEYFTFQNCFGDKTLFQDIHILPAGHCLTIKEGSLKEREYWDLEYTSDAKEMDEGYYADRLMNEFENSIKKQLMSDVPLGTYLSGGMDSGSITAVTKRWIDDLHTFTCGFDRTNVAEKEIEFDESGFSRMFAKDLDTNHHEIILRSGDLERVFAKYIWHIEEPRVSMTYQNYYLNKLTKRDVTVVLSGNGGDELFAGYPWRHRRVAGKRGVEEFSDEYYKCWMRFYSDDEKKNLFSDETNKKRVAGSSRESFKEIVEHCKTDDPLHRALYFDAKTFLHGLLVVEDKLSMAWSVEMRVPFLDDSLVDFARQIPSHLKLKAGDHKYILKKAMCGLLPEKLLTRKKRGFVPPSGSWFMSDESSYIKDMILSKKALARGYFNPGFLKDTIERHISGKSDQRLLIWSLMCFEWWNRIFIDGEKIT